MNDGDKRDALTQILYLALTAPDDARMEQCIEFAELLADTMGADEVERCKAAALKLTESEQ